VVCTVSLGTRWLRQSQAARAADRMLSSLVLLTVAASVLAGPQYSYEPPNSYLPPAPEPYQPGPSVINSYRAPAPESFQQQPTFQQENFQQQPAFQQENFQQQPTFQQENSQPQNIYEAPQSLYTPPQSLYTQPEPHQSQQSRYQVQPEPELTYTPPQEKERVLSQPPEQHVGAPADLRENFISDVPVKYTRLNYAPQMDRVVNPGTGSSGPMGVYVGSCSASTVCVPMPMCNPYTGFVRGGLLREPTGPSNLPSVPLLRCYKLKDGGIGDGVCCRMPHINDPWPEFQRLFADQFKNQ